MLPNTWKSEDLRRQKEAWFRVNIRTSWAREMAAEWDFIGERDSRRPTVVLRWPLSCEIQSGVRIRLVPRKTARRWSCSCCWWHQALWWRGGSPADCTSGTSWTCPRWPSWLVRPPSCAGPPRLGSSAFGRDPTGKREIHIFVNEWKGNPQNNKNMRLWEHGNLKHSWLLWFQVFKNTEIFFKMSHCSHMGQIP